MRHELAYEQTLGYLQRQGYDIEYEETSEDAELQGVDYDVRIDGQWIDVDVKASPGGVKKPNHVWSQATYRRMQNGHMIDDFNNGFRLTEAQLADKAPRVLNDLRSVAQAA